MRSVVVCDEKNRVYSNLSLILSFDRQPFSCLSPRGVVIGRKATQVPVTRIVRVIRISVIVKASCSATREQTGERTPGENLNRDKS